MPYLLLFLLLIASPSLAQVGPVINTDCVISWDPNTETDLWGYLLSVRKDSEPYNAAATWTLTPTTSSTCSSLGTLPNGQYYAAVSAYDIYGYESLKSDEAPFYLEKLTVIISIAKTGTGSGTVRSSPAGIDCGTVCSYEFPPSTSVTLTATADKGYIFTGWSGGNCSGTGTCTVNTTSQVTAVFDKAPTVIISIAKTGTGSGTVRSSPAGINCGTVCSYEFPPSTSVKLMATAASGSVFAGWIGGGCSGTGNCTVKATSLVTAIFNKKTK